MKPLFHHALEPDIPAGGLRHTWTSTVVLAIALIVAISCVVGFWYTTVPYLVR